MRRGKRGSEGARERGAEKVVPIGPSQWNGSYSYTVSRLARVNRLIDWLTDITIDEGSTLSMDKVLTLKARTKCSVYGSQFQR